MFPTLFRIGPFVLDSYGFFMAVGFVVADYVIIRQCRDRGMDGIYSFSLAVWLVIGAIPTSRLLYILDNWSFFKVDPKSMIFTTSGWVWYGGVVGGILALFLASRFYMVSFLVTADLCVPALAIGEAIGRIGCFTSGDGDWGTPTTLPWGVAFPDAVIGWGPGTVLKLDSHWNLVTGYFPGVRVHPAMLYETVLYTIVFFVLWTTRTSKPDGRTFYRYLVLAGAARFIVEFWRINRRVLWMFSQAQLISVALVLLGGIGLFFGGSRPCLLSGTGRSAEALSLPSADPCRREKDLSRLGE